MNEPIESKEVAMSGQPIRRLALIAILLLLGVGAVAAYWLATAVQSGSFRARAAALPPQPLDLIDYYQASATDFVNGRFPWGEVPRGAKTLGNIPLAIDGMICLWGGANAKVKLVFPKAIDHIVVNRKFETLYVYHGAFFQSPEGSPVYRLTMHYADGSVRESTISYGLHLLDWYQIPNETVSELGDRKSEIVWRGDAPKSTSSRPTKLRFSITSVPNPKPSQEVKSISLTSALGNSAGCILAMTTGPADLLKVDPGATAAAK